MSGKPKSLAILYSTGGLGDVGRHAIRAALDALKSDKNETNKFSSIKILTQFPETLSESNWNCGCPEPHSFTQDEIDVMNIIKITDWSVEEVSAQIDDHVVGVVSCLGNRQPFYGDRVGTAGTKAMVESLMKSSTGTPCRVVAISSVGIRDDWPPVEWFWGGTLMKYLFLTICRREYNDLTGVEETIADCGSLDYLLVRPVGIGEDVIPVNGWVLQKEKYKDTPEFNMAKLDVARFMVQEALVPTLHNKAVVIGGVSNDEVKNDGTQETASCEN